MTSTSTGNGLKITLNSGYEFAILAVIAIFGLVLSYGIKLFPTWSGLAGLASVVVIASGYIGHDLENASGWPRWATFILMTVVAGIMSAISLVSNDPTLGIAGWLTWGIAVMGYVLHVVSADAGANLPTHAETWITAVLGFGIAAATWFLANPTAGYIAALAALATIGSQYIHVSVEAGQVTVTPTPPTTPPPVPAVPAAM